MAANFSVTPRACIFGHRDRVGNFEGNMVVEYIDFVNEMASSAGVDVVSCQITRVRRVVRRTVGFDETEERTARRLPWAGFFVGCALASAAASIGDDIRSPCALSSLPLFLGWTVALFLLHP